MNEYVKCVKCEVLFVQINTMYCGMDFCNNCIYESQRAVINARNETYDHYIEMGYSIDEAHRVALKEARKVECERKEMKK